jgi:hypothetical protein
VTWMSPARTPGWLGIGMFKAPASSGDCLRMPCITLVVVMVHVMMVNDVVVMIRPSACRSGKET